MNGFFNRVISDISVVLKETTLAISDSIETGSQVETEIVSVDSLITRLKKQTKQNKKKNRSSGSGYLDAKIISDMSRYIFANVFCIPFLQRH